MEWSDVARVCRRVCVLRERGQHDEAERLRAGTLSEIVAAARTPTDTDASLADRLEATFAAEVERVANAAVLAELLVPLLSEQLRPLASSQSSSPVAVTDLTRAAKSPAPRATASIADFIDEMIAQESPPDPSGGGAQRRAS